MNVKLLIEIWRNIMINKTIGFIGGGRITRIFLEAFQNRETKFSGITVSDNDPEILKKMNDRFPEVKTITGDNKIQASEDIVFVALHPPVIAQALAEINGVLKNNTIVVSLAPKHTIKILTGYLGGFNRIARIIPNGPKVFFRPN